MTLEETTGLLFTLRAAFPDVRLPDFQSQAGRSMIKLWACMLGDLEIEEVKRATAELLNTSRYFPRIADIRSLVAARRLDLPSFEQVMLEVARAKSAPETLKLHPLAREAFRAVGGFFSFNHEKSTVFRAQFREVYEAMREDALRKVNFAPAVAFIEAQSS